MDEGTLRDFRELLEGRMRGLLGGGYAPGARLADRGGIEPMDEADLASHHCDQALVHTFHYRNQQLVHEIKSAIKRIDDGDFGTCCLCTTSIGLDRLKARPTAMLCIRCQEMMESARRRYSGSRRMGAVA
jgi:DnaK suppressor protein